MAGNRAAAEAFILKNINALLPDGKNKKIYQDLFASMNDKQFEEFINKLGDESECLAIITPNLADTKLSLERNMKLAEELGHNFFERIWMNDCKDSPPYLSPIPYMIVDLPLRRQAQMLEKKEAIPVDNKSVDDLTGQPSGESGKSKISYPEIQVLTALGLENTLTEFLKVRGGDTGAFNASNESISKTGGVSLKAIESKATGVESTATLKTLLTCMHLSSTL